MGVTAGRDGFFFSFDALLALSIIGLSTVFVLYTSSPLQDSVSPVISEYRHANSYAEDAMQLGVQRQFQRAFDDGTVTSYVDDSNLTDTDREKSVVDVIAMLWAADDTTVARNVSRRFFDRIIADEYGYRISVIDDTRHVVYNTSTGINDADLVANSRRMVSGVQKNRPQQGYIARARAEKVRKNMSRVLTFSPMGGAPDGGRLNIWKQFNLSNVDTVANATLYIAVNYGCDNSQFENLRVNGNNIKNEIDWIHQQEDDCPQGTGTGAYGVINDTIPYLENGTNEIYMRFRNNQYHAQTNPGMKLELELTDQGKRSELSSRFDRRIRFDEVEGDERGNDNVGVYAVKPFAIPQNTTDINTSVQLTASNVDRVYNNTAADCGGGGTNISDVMVFFNGEKIYSDYAPTDGNVSLTFNLTDRTEAGTNVVAAYFNTFGDCHWGSDTVRLESGLTGDTGSYIDVAYDYGEQNQLVFGKIELTRNEHIGGGVENPKIFNKSFDGRDILSTNLHIAELFSDRVTVNVTDADGTERQAFRSRGFRSVPSSIFIDRAFYNTTGNNTIYMEDDVQKDVFVPESSFEYTMLVPAQVGYGDTFPNRSAANTDAKRRLNETLGPFVESTELTSTPLNVNNVPWLFGPVTVEIEVWEDQ